MGSIAFLSNIESRLQTSDIVTEDRETVMKPLYRHGLLYLRRGNSLRL